MHPLRTFRRARGLSITDLALQSGVPARAIGEAESGGRDLSPAQLELLAWALSVTPEQIQPPRRPPVSLGILWQLAIAIILAVVALITFAPLARMLLGQLPGSSLVAHAEVSAVYAADRAEPTAAPPAAPTRPPAPAPAQPLGAPLGLAAGPAEPAALPPSDDATPRACPLLAEPARVVITQGFGEGTHSPASLAGAIDLGIDADGDGIADPGPTAGVVVLATHTGVAQVYLNSWPGGNVVRIVDEAGGWATLYAHLDMVAVTDGAPVTGGTPIGTVGSTGMSSGPHLHYEIRRGGSNIDPAGVAPCWRLPG